MQRNKNVMQTETDPSQRTLYSFGVSDGIFARVSLALSWTRLVPFVSVIYNVFNSHSYIIYTRLKNFNP